MTYSQPAAPYIPPPPAMPPAKTKFGALAWTSLILGIVGVVGSPIIFLNDVTAIVAAVGAILGIIALFGTRKVLAVIGVVLCVGGIAVTVAVQQATVKQLDNAVDAAVNQGSAGNGVNNAAGQAAGNSATAWGGRYTWQDGLAVKIAAPVACKPSQSAAPSGIVRAVRFTITVTNGSKQPFDASLLTTMGDAQFNGKTAETVIDSGGSCGDGGMSAATVLPGKSYTYDVAYSVGAKSGEMQLALQPDFSAGKAVFTGKA